MPSASFVSCKGLGIPLIEKGLCHSRMRTFAFFGLTRDVPRSFVPHFPFASARQHSGNVPRCQNSQGPEKADTDSPKQAAVLHHSDSYCLLGSDGVVLLDDWAIGRPRTRRPP
jgi:hypothetical protein